MRSVCIRFESTIFDFLRLGQCSILHDRLHTYLGLNSNGSRTKYLSYMTIDTL